MTPLRNAAIEGNVEEVRRILEQLCSSHETCLSLGLHTSLLASHPAESVLNLNNATKTTNRMLQAFKADSKQGA